MISLLYYSLQNTFKKISLLSQTGDNNDTKDRISAKIGFKIAFDQLKFWSFTVQSFIQVRENNKSC